MNYGYDVNGRKIRETNKKLCQFCGKQTGSSLSDGTEINSSCGCDGLNNMIHSKTEYTITLEGEFGNSKVLYITGYEEAKKRYSEITSRGQSLTVVTLAQVIETNR